jgi:hypothetical protein
MQAHSELFRLLLQHMFTVAKEGRDKAEFFLNLMIRVRGPSPPPSAPLTSLPRTRTPTRTRPRNIHPRTRAPTHHIHAMHTHSCGGAVTAQHYLVTFYPAAATDVGLLDEGDGTMPPSRTKRSSEKNRGSSTQADIHRDRALVIRCLHMCVCCGAGAGYWQRCPPALQYFLVPFFQRCVARVPAEADVLSAIIFSDAVRRGGGWCAGATPGLLRATRARIWAGQAGVLARGVSAGYQAAGAVR